MCHRRLSRARTSLTPRAWLDQEGTRVTRFAIGTTDGEARATRPSFIECGVSQGVPGPCRMVTAGGKARATLRHAANDPSVRWPAWRAIAGTDARHAAQRSFTEAGPRWWWL